MRQRGSRSSWFPILLLLSGFVQAQNQREALQRSEIKPYVMTPPGTMTRVLKTVKNQQLRLSDYSDRIIVINTFASWCGPCVLNLKGLKQFAKEYKSRRIKIIGLVSSENDRDLANVLRFIRQQKVDFQVLWDTDGFSQSLVKAVKGRPVIPQTFVIDNEGRIWTHLNGYSELTSSRVLREALDQVGRQKER